MVAVPRGGEREVVLPEGWKRSPNPYSYAIRSGDTVFLSGLVARNGADNTFVGGDVRVQTRTIMENAGELLEAAGMTFANVVSAGLPDQRRRLRGDERGLPRVLPGRAARARHRAIRPRRTGSGRGNHVRRLIAAPRRRSGRRRPGCRSVPAIRAGQHAFVSGMLGNTPETAGDVAAQTRETLAKIDATLRRRRRVARRRRRRARLSSPMPRRSAR